MYLKMQNILTIFCKEKKLFKVFRLNLSNKFGKQNNSLEQHFKLIFFLNK